MIRINTIKRYITSQIDHWHNLTRFLVVFFKAPSMSSFILNVLIYAVIKFNRTLGGSQVTSPAISAVSRSRSWKAKASTAPLTLTRKIRYHRLNSLDNIYYIRLDINPKLSVNNTYLSMGVLKN